MVLWHWTCSHMAEQIDATGGILLPHPQVHLYGRPLTWFTDDLLAGREALGLTSTNLTCDRMEALFEVDDRASHDIEPWTFWRFRYKFDKQALRELEHGCRPMKWWVSEVPIAAKRVQ